MPRDPRPSGAMEALDKIRRLVNREYKYRARLFKSDPTSHWHEYHALRSIRADVLKIIAEVNRGAK